VRILHAIARLNVGGAALQVLELAAGQRRRGHDVLVLHGVVPEGEESMQYLADELEVPTQFLPALRRELSPRRDLAAIAAVRSALRAERPDVLHTHAAKAGAAGRLAALTTRRPARVHTFHGHVLRGYFGARQERAFLRIERLLARTTDALVAPSEEVRDDLVSLGVAPAERFEVIRYGFAFAAPSDARARLRAELGLEDDAFVVGFVGRLTAVKRPLELVRAIAAVDGATLVLVGDGEERSAAEALARELGVDARFPGYRQEVQDWYAAFDAFALASANEGTPVAAIEALAAGRPVVATRVGGTPAVVDHGETGFLVGSADELCARLDELRGDAARRAEMGRLGAARMRERFGVERMVDEHERLYARLAG
jgi:glycosyltransferase involved in cell wall biosynthesis